MKLDSVTLIFHIIKLFVEVLLSSLLLLSALLS